MTPREHFDATASDLDVINELDQPEDTVLLAELLSSAGDELESRRVAKKMRDAAAERFSERECQHIAQSNNEHMQAIA
jgi:hypothetical protein